MAIAEKPRLGVLKVSLEDAETYVKKLQKRGDKILLEANIFQIAKEILLGEKIKDIRGQHIVESDKGYVGVRFSWNFKEIKTGFDPQIECDSIEIGVNVATGTLSFVQAGEKTPLGSRERKLEQGVEFLDRKKWKRDPKLIREPLIRAIENPQLSKESRLYHGIRHGIRLENANTLKSGFKYVR